MLYSENFEGLDIASPGALGDTGWLVGANVFEANGDFAYNYFAFPAPNGGPGFSGIIAGQGGVDQGNQQLNVYNDYNNADHGNGSNRRIAANFFRNVSILGTSDVGREIFFFFDIKQGNIGGDSTALAFLKVQETSNNSFADLALVTADTTAPGTDWSENILSLVVQPEWVGETLQIGFINTADNFGDTGLFYDNFLVTIPEPSSAALCVLGVAGLLGIRRRK